MSSDETDTQDSLKENTDENTDELIDELTDEEKESLCRAFTLLDSDGDGVIEPEELQQLLIAWGRMPADDELDDIMSHARGTGCEGATGMSFKEFQSYLTKQLVDTRDEDALREAFQVFDSDPLTGKLNVTELRHYLKFRGLKLTDDELDFLFREEDYWMLEENIFEYEHLINKILDKPSCNSPFLHC